MAACSSINLYSRNAIHLRGHQQHIGSLILSVLYRRKSSSRCFCFRPLKSLDSDACLYVSRTYASPPISFNKLHRTWSQNHKDMLQPFTVTGSLRSKGPLKTRLNISFPHQNLDTRLLVSNQGMISKIRGNFGHVSWSQDCAATGVIIGLLVCYSSSEAAHAEAAKENKCEEDDCDSLHSKYSHGKKVYTDFSVIGIPGDGRCLFRSVAHGACLRAGKPPPNESLQREIADELRARVADEFIKRRQESEWFVEGDFDSYVAQIRKPHVWGGEPELFMASHVLEMPITVYMHDKDAGGLISIAEYGQEYGKENPIRVLYHGFGHYDALHIPGRKGGNPKL